MTKLDFYTGNKSSPNITMCQVKDFISLCGGGSRRSEQILTISELDLNLKNKLRCRKFGPNRILISRTRGQIDMAIYRTESKKYSKKVFENVIVKLYENSKICYVPLTLGDLLELKFFVSM